MVTCGFFAADRERGDIPCRRSLTHRRARGIQSRRDERILPGAPAPGRRAKCTRAPTGRKERAIWTHGTKDDGRYVFPYAPFAPPGLVSVGHVPGARAPGQILPPRWGCYPMARSRRSAGARKANPGGMKGLCRRREPPESERSRPEPRRASPGGTKGFCRGREPPESERSRPEPRRASPGGTEGFCRGREPPENGRSTQEPRRGERNDRSGLTERPGNHATPIGGTAARHPPFPAPTGAW